MDETTDVAVVGGGLAGLAAAAVAARAGRRVVLHDAGALGGRARSTRREGFVLNQGPHALSVGGEADRVLADLGVAPAGSPPPAQGGVVLRHDSTHRLPGTPTALLRTTLLRPGAKLRLARLFATLPRLRPADLAQRTVDEWFDDQGITGELRALLAALVRLSTYADAPGLLSAEVAVSQLQLAVGHGVRYLDGGWGTMVDALAGRARDAGAELRHGERVLGLSDGPGGPVLETAGGPLCCGAVVVAAGTPAGAAAVLGSSPEEWDGIGPATTMSCLDLGLSRVPPTTFALGLDHATYASVHAPPAELAPPGGAVVHLARYHEVGAEPLPADDERRFLDALAERLGIREDDIVTARFLPRMVTSGGFPTAVAGGFAGRPPVEVPRRRNVFVAGDWVGPVGLLADAALASGADAGKLAVTAAAATPRTAPQSAAW